jgi:hypothetical protein
MRPLTVLLVIPTGIGAKIGGYAGDGIPVARLLAGVADCLITHPNVLNGAMLSWPLDNALYVEGYALDRFCAGQWNLRPVHRNRIGVLLDAALDDTQRIHHLNAIEAARWTLGIDILGYHFTDIPLGVTTEMSSKGISWGALREPEALLRGAEQLKVAGAEAIAVVTLCPESDDAAYLAGAGVDPVGGVEAVMSHLIVRHLQIPAAHAPAFASTEIPQRVYPRAAAESLGHTFLPCILAGLSRAPRYVNTGVHEASDLTAAQVDVIVSSMDCCGGSGLLALMERPNPPILLVVEENTTHLSVHPESLGLKAFRVRSYLEACGWLVAWKNGFTLGHNTLSEVI